MRDRTTRVHFIISIAIHLLLVLVWTVSETWLFDRDGGRRPEPEQDSFVFEVVETPDYLPDEEPEEPTRFVSDRNTRAADSESPAEAGMEVPYSPGEFIFRQYEPPERDADDTEGSDLPQGEVGEVAQSDVFADGESGRDYSIPAHSIDFSNLVSSLSRNGGMSFNTYEWDFAPYMLAMKRRVERNLHPPYAFTHMGMVSGTNILSFTVLRDGTVKNLTILGSDTHFSLDRTSLRAIELSMPFMPLPVDFPEDVLEVTAKFSYLLR